MAFDAYLKIGAIPGEATDEKHKEWIELLSYSWGVSNPAAGSTAAGAAGRGGAGKVNISDISITKYIDKASPKLFLSCCQGEHHPEAFIKIYRAEGDHQQYLQYKMTDVLITGVSTGGSSSGCEAAPTESVTINYSKLELTYIPAPAPGEEPNPERAGWDLMTSKKF